MLIKCLIKTLVKIKITEVLLVGDQYWSQASVLTPDQVELSLKGDVLARSQSTGWWIGPRILYLLVQIKVGPLMRTSV